MDLKQIEDNAIGNISTKKLIDESRGFSVMHYLKPDEQPHYVFQHSDKGIRITAGGDKSTPYNSYEGGSKYFVITNQRIIFISDNEGVNDIVSFSYSYLSSCEFKKGIFKYRITIIYDEYSKISFYDSGKNTDHFEDAVNYIDDQITSDIRYSPSLSHELAQDIDDIQSIERVAKQLNDSFSLDVFENPTNEKEKFLFEKYTKVDAFAYVGENGWIKVNHITNSPIFDSNGETGENFFEELKTISLLFDRVTTGLDEDHEDMKEGLKELKGFKTSIFTDDNLEHDRNLSYKHEYEYNEDDDYVTDGKEYLAKIVSSLYKSASSES